MMDEKLVLQGSRAQLKKNIEKEYGRIARKDAANQNGKNSDRVNANDLAAILRTVYIKNKKKAKLAIRNWRGKKAA